ncbi:Nipped-B-like protein B [Madurella mycetomatis]|uniref:Nipped-B-like protein B n=1 Tax=Madurella mycetomatis TaxID=100816 RepID=A0A175W7N0_9PEZI|nr:Nipped-B-like protein B [Madurella mycetomatis]
MARYGDAFTDHIRGLNPYAYVRSPSQHSSHHRASDRITGDQIIAPRGAIPQLLNDFSGDRPIRVVLNNCHLHIQQPDAGRNPPGTGPTPVRGPAGGGAGGGASGRRTPRPLRARSPSPGPSRRPAPALAMPGGVLSDDSSPSDGEFRRTMILGVCDGCFTRQRLNVDGFCAECEFFAVGPAPGAARDRPATAWNGVRYIPVSTGDSAARRELRERMRDRDRARLRDIERDVNWRDAERERDRLREIERERDRARERARELARELEREKERERERGRERMYYAGYYSDSDFDSSL